MPTNQDYRDLLDEKFKHIATLMNAQFTSVHDKLSDIEKQTIKTNGRVTKLEDEVVDIKLVDKEHYFNCPQIERIDKLNEELMEYKMVKKYPKFMLGSVVVAILISIVAFLKSFF